MIRFLAILIMWHSKQKNCIS